MLFAASPAMAVDDSEEVIQGTVLEDGPGVVPVNQSESIEKIIEQAQSVRPDGTIHETDGIKWKVVSEYPSSGDIDGYQPLLKVGAGWYLYLYMTTDEYNLLVGGAGGIATFKICAALTAAGAAPDLACAGISAAIAGFLIGKGAPGRNQCGELKLAWDYFVPTGYKIINKPYSRI